MILTLGCAKYRLLGHDYGNVPGTELPLLLDMGQCNDAYAAIQVALALAAATGKSVNELPLSLDLSYLEQKAVAVLLSLLHRGVTDIRLGPTMPAFLTPAAVQVLVDKFGLTPADLEHPEEEIERMLQRGQ
jgi:hydroxylamine reductase (hybrid-cluster protein)